MLYNLYNTNLKPKTRPGYPVGFWSQPLIVQDVQGKLCMFIIHYNTSLNYISLQEIFKALNTQCKSTISAQPIAGQCLRGRGG